MLLHLHTSCSASEWPYRGVTVLTDGSRVSQLLLLRLYLQKQRAERCDEHDEQAGQGCSLLKKDVFLSVMRIFSQTKMEACLHNNNNFFFVFTLEFHSSLLKLIGCRGIISRVLGVSLYPKNCDEVHLMAWNLD